MHHIFHFLTIQSHKYTLIIILSLALFVRFYNFENRINFGLEQSLPLITASDYLEKPSLLGLQSVRRQTSLNHDIFFAPFFTYSLVPLQIITNHNPLLITAFFALVNLCTGILLYLITKIFCKERVAAMAMFLFLFNSIMISHSLFIWINNYTVLISTLLIYLLWRIKLNNFRFASVFMGGLVGLNIGMEYMYVLTGATFVFVAMIYLSSHKLRDILLFILGGIIASLPTIVFDLRNNFYHLTTLWQYVLDLLNSPNKTGFEYMHFLQFIPPLAILGAVLIDKLGKHKKFLVGPVLALYFLINITQKDISFDSAVGMADGLAYPMLVKAAHEIAQDNPNNFNVATTFDLDSRALGLRYLLEYKHNKKPLGVTEYPEAALLYVFAKNEYDFSNAPWEIKSFNANSKDTLSEINGFSVYRLVK